MRFGVHDIQYFYVCLLTIVSNRHRRDPHLVGLEGFGARVEYLTTTVGLNEERGSSNKTASIGHKITQPQTDFLNARLYSTGVEAEWRVPKLMMVSEPSRRD